MTNTDKLRKQTFTLTDGRALCWAEFGNPTGVPAVVLHGTPGSRLQLACLDEPSRKAGVRIICPDRPGIGFSDPSDTLSFTSYASDLAALLDHLEIDRAALVGYSAGGGYALAAAAESERWTQLIMVSGIVPQPPRDARRGMSRTNALAFTIADRMPRVLASIFRSGYGKAVADGVPGIENFLKSLPDVDAAAARKAGLTLLADDGVEAIRQGTTPAAFEIQRYRRPLGAKLDSIDIPVTFIHGDADTNVPLGVAQWAAGQIPGATVTVIAGGGHFAVMDRPEVLMRAITSR